MEDCEKFNAQYVIFTVWHYKINPLYYSEVYREWRSNAEETERYQGKIKGYILDEGLDSPSNDQFVDYDRIRVTIKDIASQIAMIQN